MGTDDDVILTCASVPKAYCGNSCVLFVKSQLIALLARKFDFNLVCGFEDDLEEHNCRGIGRARSSINTPRNNKPTSIHNNRTGIGRPP